MPLSDELEALAIASAMTLVAIAAMFVPIWYFEHRQGASTGRYASRSFVHDVAYSVFYASGLSNLIGTAWLASGAARLEFLDWKLLAGLPTLVAAFLFWILSDLFLYWVHRAQHAIPWLWRLHSIHHTAESLTFVTAHRVHPLENLWQNTVSVAPLLILGAPPKLWVPVAMLQSFFDAVQHAELDWTYGPFYRVFVSPVFHRIHHSRERREHDRNFSKVLSAWDHLFGTASSRRTPPARVGVDGMRPEPTLAGQVIGPFRRAPSASTAAQTVDASAR